MDVMNLSRIPADLKQYVEAEILPRYAGFDKAHRRGHAERVIEESLRLGAFYDTDPGMLYVIAAYHDVGLVAGRERHHLVSGEMLAADKRLRAWFGESHIQMMREAVEDHRASSDHEPRSIYGKIVAEADRLIDPDVTLRRTVQYGLKHYPELDKEAQYERFALHLRTKYGEGGYLKLWIKQTDNAARLARLRQIIENPPELRACFERLFEEETRSL